MPRYKVHFYEDIEGRVPMKKLLDGMDPDIRAKTASRISLLERYGPEIIGELSDVYRLNVRYDSTRILSLFCFNDHRNIIITGARITKSFRIPVYEYKHTRSLKEDYFLGKVQK